MIGCRTFKTTRCDAGRQDAPLAHQLKATREKVSRGLTTYTFSRGFQSRFGGACTSDRGGLFGRQPDDRMYATIQADTHQHLTHSFTSFTSAVFCRSERQIDRLRGTTPLLFTSFTSFSKGGVIHAGTSAPALARINLSPLREWSERSEQRGVKSPPSVENPVHFPVFGEVNRRLLFTSAGERGVSA
jgi:hypothetical protein